MESTNSTSTLLERCNRAEADLRAAESRLKELRGEQAQMAGAIEELRARRLTHVLRADHSAVDADDAEIQRAERESERQLMLMSEAEADVQAFERKLAPLAEELRHEKRIREMAAARVEAIDQAKQFVAAFKSASHALAVHALKRPQLVELFGTTDGNAIANDADAVLEELQVGLGNRGWKAPGVGAPQFSLRALLPPDSELPALASSCSGITSAPAAQLISHPRPPIAATSPRA